MPVTDALALLLVAPPGAGKGTQAPRLAGHYAIAHISSGDLLRRNVAEGTSLGKIAAAYLSRGDLVPDDLVIEMLTVPVLEAYRSGGFVLDGFPRTRGQAEEAQRVARQFGGIQLQAVIHLVVRRDELRRRLVTRAERDGRNDDTEITIAHRLEVFDAQTEPLLGYYAERGLVVDINGEQPVEKVFSDIVNAVDRLRATRATRGTGT
ncbi:MAG TPA: adenylate kinase [Acidimicrobiales bacterium]